MAEEEKQPKILTILDLMKEGSKGEDLMAFILDMSGEDPMTLPVGRGFAWFGNYDQAGRLGPPVVIKLGEPSPFNERMGVLAMFQEEHEVRVYSVPIAQAKKGEILTFTRHTLCKAAPTFFFEALPPGVFEAEIAAELSALASATAPPMEHVEEEEQQEEEEGENKGEGGEETGEQTGAPAT